MIISQYGSIAQVSRAADCRSAGYRCKSDWDLSESI